MAQAQEAGSRFRLLGIVAPKHAHEGAASGVALIAVDGKPPRAFAVGARVDDDLVLQSVSLRTASIGSTAGKKLVLEIPRLPAPATGTLPPIGTPAAALAPHQVVAPPPPAVVPPPMPQPSPAVGAPPGPVSIERDGGVQAQ